LLSLGVVFEDDEVTDNKGSELDEHLLRKVRKFSEYFAGLSVKHFEL
jgi:hypothetical protein